jgi:hypothetical protein
VRRLEPNVRGSSASGCHVRLLKCH